MKSQEKKVYQDVLLAIECRSTRAAEHNKLAAIEIKSEDCPLKEKIQLYRKNLIRLPEKAARSYWDSPKAVAIKQEIEKHRTALVAYCETILDSEKPEWQTVAEQNGWKSPEEVERIRLDAIEAAY